MAIRMRTPSSLSSTCVLFLVALLGTATVTAQRFYMGAGGRDGRTSTAPAVPGAGGPGTVSVGPNGEDGDDEGEDEDCTLDCDCVTWLLGPVANGGVATDGAHYQSVPVPHPVATGMVQIICALKCMSISGGEGSGCVHLDGDQVSEPEGFV
jgi:hypothetical protein